MFLKSLAKAISYLGHPLLVLSYILVLMLLVNPFAFGIRDISDQRGILLLLSVFTTSFMIPGLGVTLMKPLGLIKSLEMEDKQDRIGPYIICGIFYLWLFKNFIDGAVPALYTKFSLAAVIGLFLAFFINIFTKISAHTTGMGALLAMVIMMAFSWPGLSMDLGAFQLSMTVLIAVTVVFAGLVGFARLVLGSHDPVNVYRGYAAGIIAVLLAELIL